ncbi:M56 family metallopeptidase [Tissierella pigra]|nr:M56 family metallopeptidase [Tissierella pigra]
MSICLINILILFLSLLKNKNKFIKHFNVTSLIVFIILIIFRTLFNFEFKNSININSKIILPKIIDWLRMPLYVDSNLTLLSFFLFIWIIGSCIISLKTIFTYYKFKIYLKNISKFSYIQDLELLEKIKQELNIDKNINLYRSNEITIPIVVGITEFSIYLPNIILSENKLRNILIHELNHIKGKDNFKKIIILLFKILFWWNPFIYLLNKDIDHILEIQCDIRTVSYMTDKERIKYLESILAIIKNTKYINSNALINNLQVSALYNDDDNKLKQRFNLVLDHNNKQQNKKYNLIFCFVFIAIFMSSYIFTFKPIYYPKEDYIFIEEDDFIYERDSYILKIKNKE